MMNNLIRYSVIKEKNPREILLLRGSGCQFKKCRFCDYHLDFSKDQDENFKLNQAVLNKVTGLYGKLEIVNSGSFVDLDTKTIELIKNICLEKNIREIHFESHWMYRNEIANFKEFFKENHINLKMKIGVETFDEIFRESYLIKGMKNVSAEKISEYFDEVCLLQGLPGQTLGSMLKDIAIALKYFKRVCVNIMNENSNKIKPDPSVVNLFFKEIYPIYIDHPQVDILLSNTDFGVGGNIN